MAIEKQKLANDNIRIEIEEARLGIDTDRLKLSKQERQDRLEISRLHRELLKEIQIEETKVKLQGKQIDWDNTGDHWFSKISREETQSILTEYNHRLLILASPLNISPHFNNAKDFQNWSFDLEICEIDDFLSQYYPNQSTECPVQFYHDYFKETISKIDVNRLQKLLSSVATYVLYSDISKDTVNFRVAHWQTEQSEPTHFPPFKWNWLETKDRLVAQRETEAAAILVVKQTIIEIHRLLTAYLADSYYLTIDPFYEPQLFEIFKQQEQPALQPFVESLRKFQVEQRTAYYQELAQLKVEEAERIRQQQLERHNKYDKRSTPNQIAQRKNSSSLDETKVVVSIQIDDSKIGYAYSFRDDKRVIYRIEWDKQPYASPFMKPYLLYAPNGKLEEWGYAAASRFAELRRNRSLKDYTFFNGQYFRFVLKRNSYLKGFAVIDLVSDLLQQLKNIAIEDLSSAMSGTLQLKDILWCLPIPSIWNDTAKYFLRASAIRAGLITDEECDQLLFVPEHEASLIYCQEMSKTPIGLGKRLMLVDCRDDEVLVTAYELTQNGELKEVIEGTYRACGSTHVDTEFKNFLGSKLSAAALTRYEEEDPIGYLELLEDWERKKCDFDPEMNGRIYFYIPNRIYRILSKDYPEVLEKIASIQDGDDEKLHVSREMMVGIFTPVLDGLVRAVQEQLAKLDRCDVMYLVGSFAASQVLRGRIVKEFGNRIQIVMPPFPSISILNGAVFFGLTPFQPRRGRPTRLTYGYQSCQLFDPNLDRAHLNKREFLDDTQNCYICNRFIPLVIAGDIVDIDQKSILSLPPIRSEQRTISINLFATKSKNPRYVDEIGVKELGKLEIDISSSVGRSNRTVEVSCYFGRTEIAVEATDLQTGKTYNTKLGFTSTY